MVWSKYGKCTYALITHIASVDDKINREQNTTGAWITITDHLLYWCSAFSLAPIIHFTASNLCLFKQPPPTTDLPLTIIKRRRCRLHWWPVANSGRRNKTEPTLPVIRTFGSRRKQSILPRDSVIPADMSVCWSVVALAAILAFGAVSSSGKFASTNNKMFVRVPSSVLNCNS